MIQSHTPRAWVSAVLLAVTCAAHAGEPAPLRWTSPTEGGRFRVTIRPVDAGPIPIGRFHAWRVRVTDIKGRPIDTARITVGGGMEGHGHGLPTAPRVTRALGSGESLIEGIKFTMSGEWTLVLVIQDAGVKETAQFRINVEY